VLVRGLGYCWKAYQLVGELVAACYVDGRLLRRDMHGWWVATYHGDKRRLTGDVADRLRGTSPVGWPVPLEQAALLKAVTRG
jgi:hypothetical protein